MDWILDPWPWYVSGPLIAVTMFALLFSGKNFGMSSNFRTLCAVGGGGKFADFFKFNWKSQRWNLVVMAGAILGGYLASSFLTNSTEIPLNANTVDALKNMGFAEPGGSYVPSEIFGVGAMTSLKGLSILIGGGLLIGFGTRYAGGCTSGHAISGLSNLQVPSLIATIGFFIGGLIMTHFLLPLIF